MDSTLPGLPKQRTFIAANLKEVEDLMPHYVLQLLIAVSLLPKNQAYVSIYESGSHDNTGRWLQLLDDMLDLLDIRHDIVTGGMTRQGEERVAFLSKLRNAAISPMQQGENGSLPEWPADRLLYINDVYFCAQDIVRLLQHTNVSAVCAMDFWKHASRPDAPGHFYDVWVMRDVEGHRVNINPPYLHHAYSRFRLEQGLPFPVSCCWNGMISLDAQPFAEGLRFRAHRQHECQESEASQMCTDLFHLGRTDFIVDPGVQVAYEPQIAARAHAPELRIKQTTYRDIQEADPVDWAFTPQAFYKTCCNKSDYIDDADLSKCHPAISAFLGTRKLIFGMNSIMW
ncbi:hypothetical protein CVIRNUC_000155 [Coccomyxa viridis]|uniref:Uncharacterized protein n=1 Tax=Coccomyxa viridis TaxID=1274662 RepID=A0AAV1HR22_9CHLO|nr:hypothetical protein CVIRNUC_000155 [Coccomyxa viridis]